MNGQKSVLTSIRGAKILSERMSNRAKKKSEIFTEFWLEMVCRKLYLTNFNCSINFGQTDDGTAILTNSIGDVFGVDKISPTHFTFLPGDSKSALSIGRHLMVTEFPMNFNCYFMITTAYHFDQYCY